MRPGSRPFSVPADFDRVKAAEMGAVFSADGTGVWMPPADFARVARGTAPLDPAVRARIARQTAGCKGCGDPGVDGL